MKQAFQQKLKKVTIQLVSITFILGVLYLLVQTPQFAHFAGVHGEIEPISLTNFSSSQIPTDIPQPTIKQEVAGIQTTRQIHPVQSSLIDCVGPDGNHFQTTQQECDNFNLAWGNGAKTGNTQQTKTNTTQAKIDCVVSTGTYKLTQSDCAWLKEYNNTLSQVGNDYSSSVMEAYKNRVKELDSQQYQSGPNLPSVVVPTAYNLPPVPSPTCQPLGHTTYSLCGQ